MDAPHFMIGLAKLCILFSLVCMSITMAFQELWDDEQAMLAIVLVFCTAALMWRVFFS